MNISLFIITVLIVFAFAFPLLRFVAMACGIIPAAPDSSSCSNTTEPAAASAPPTFCPEDELGVAATQARRTGYRYAVSSLMGLLFLYFVVTGRFSVDALYTSSLPAGEPPRPAVSHHHGHDWKIVDGIRWFRVTGTDSAGIGYSGWTSELLLRDAPPEASSDTPGILEKIGIPSAKEKIEGVRQLRKVGKALEQALSRD